MPAAAAARYAVSVAFRMGRLAPFIKHKPTIHLPGDLAAMRNPRCIATSSNSPPRGHRPRVPSSFRTFVPSSAFLLLDESLRDQLQSQPADSLSDEFQPRARFPSRRSSRRLNNKPAAWCPGLALFRSAKGFREEWGNWGCIDANSGYPQLARHLFSASVRQLRTLRV